ncbi:hypothetical protein KC332_g13997 [Hortaea werneckii]|uniref:Uncharacterized protein n=2 Tax=Hortaea werneckii TaxID=91943 RepID=A0A3M7I2N4_HORWE|nr:hypothetical protein KC358_g7498 [Hortaea werneckii]OTA32851.1 hypothetical protein BTJ68_08001 [Hortaea werneckii EXF-2000]KAI6839106.1 hypothetical protein KC350_g5713 [Hortaea werneckii]KAI6843981.1 hypothetical protein KC342_g609 [Hortaea werneckii]KAI6942331.1 hypothetical protein KC341_g2314 [Hortaea werneckii]
MVSQSLIVLCCICGAAVAVFIGWAVSHRFVKPAETKEPASGDFNQAQYMREVRLRHQDQLAGIMGGVSALGNVVLSHGTLCDGGEMEKVRNEPGDLCAGTV